MAISVLILTLNEEDNLPRCLASLDWCDDVVVLDSGSTDRTCAIAEERSARVFERPFDDYASQRNHGLEKIDYRHEWLLMVDADEEVPADLVQEMRKAVERAASEVTLFRMRRKDYFLGRWIRRSSGYPTWFGRLARLGRVRVERTINEEYVTDGKVELLQTHLNHYPFNKGFHAWFEKHNRYSTMEGELLEARQAERHPLSDLLHRDPTLRRKWIKSLVYRLPGRPLLMFFALYVVRGGFLDGRAGLTFCLLRSFYEFMIDCKAHEVGLRKQNLPV